jgi:ribonuclease G
LRLFRRKTRTEQAVPETAVETPQVVTTEPAQAGEERKPKRRRGSRGGRGRKRPGAAQAQSQAKAEPKTETKAKAERKPAAERKESRKEPARRRAQPRRRQLPKRAALPPAKRELLVSVDVGEQRVAVLEDDRVAEVYLERPERRSIAGNVYKGTVENVLPGMEAAFVEIGLEKNGFLYVDEIVGPELEGRGSRKIQDLLTRGQEILVQAVKDPMKTKGARLTTEISLPGRFVVFVPNGEGLGVSRRLEDDERARLRDIIKDLSPPSGGVIVRTAAEGASAEDIERDLVFLQRLWKTIQAQAKQAKAPALVYQEAELPLRVVRDVFAGDFERALVDHERTYKRIVGYLKKTSPHMAERVSRYREKQPLFHAHGVDAEIRSTLSRRVDLPSGGYLVFDYAEAFTVIDVNTGRFVGGRSKGSGARLEDTITKNNLEAVKEVVRQLRLRDIGGIIVIDFIDMANPGNRATVEEAFRTELERDRTKTYVVEISPLGLVEMTRQNVTEGPREILTKKCATCGGDGFVLSEASAAVDAERRLRALAASAPRTKAFHIQLNSRVASLLIGSGAERVAEIETELKCRFLIEQREDVPLDHFEVVKQGPVAKVFPETGVNEGDEVELKLVEVGLHDPSAGVGKLDGYSIAVGGAAKLVGKKVKVRIERVLDGTGYGTLVDAGARDSAAGPITAESEAEKPTRAPHPRKAAAKPTTPAVGPGEETPEEPGGSPAEVAVAQPEAEAEAEPEPEKGAPETSPEQRPKKKTRRGSRGGRGRKRKTAAASVAEANGPEPAAKPPVRGSGPEKEAPGEPGGSPAHAETPGPKIHLPDAELGRANGDPSAPEGEEQPKPRRKTRRGSRGGRRRRKPVATAGEPESTPPTGE